MSIITNQLKSAGLDNQECPMLNCFGHLNFVETESFFKCSICKEVFPTTKALKLWKENNKAIKSIVSQWESEDQAAHEEYLYQSMSAEEKLEESMSGGEN